jgi:hypothetical protein
VAAAGGLLASARSRLESRDGKRAVVAWRLDV